MLIIALLFIPLAIFLLLLGAAFMHVGGLQPDVSVKVSDLTPLAATTLVAVVLQYSFTKRGKATDIEKAVLNAQLAALLTSFTTLKGLVTSSLGRVLEPSETLVLIDAFESWSEAFSSFRQLLAHTHCSDLSPRCDPVVYAFVAYKTAITGNDFPVSPINPTDFSKSAQCRHRIEHALLLLNMEVAKK